MRILMLGNSLTTANGMPEMLAGLLDCEVKVQARGGARLSEHLNSKTKMGGETLRLIDEEEWDYAILQEMSKGPAVSFEKYAQSVEKLSVLLKAKGIIPVIYGTWAYDRKDKTGLSLEEMHLKMHEAFERVSDANDILLADVCRAFHEREYNGLISSDGVHPSGEGSALAADILAKVIKENENIKKNTDCTADGNHSG